MPVNGSIGNTNPEVKYFVSQHPLVNQTIGTPFGSIEECKRKIDSKVKYEPIRNGALIDLKFAFDH
jgi:hypothetical protein